MVGMMTIGGRFKNEENLQPCNVFEKESKQGLKRKGYDTYAESVKRRKIETFPQSEDSHEKNEETIINDASVTNDNQGHNTAIANHNIEGVAPGLAEETLVDTPDNIEGVAPGLAEETLVDTPHNIEGVGPGLAEETLVDTPDEKQQGETDKKERVNSDEIPSKKGSWRQTGSWHKKVQEARVVGLPKQPPKKTVELAPMSVGDKYYPTLDPRWQCRVETFGKINYFNTYDLTIHDHVFPIVLGAKPKLIRVWDVPYMASINVARQVLINDRVFTYIGHKKACIFLSGKQGGIEAHGHYKTLWIDGNKYRFQLDDQAQQITLAGTIGYIKLDTISMSVVIDGVAVCPLTTDQPQRIRFKSKSHWVQFLPPFKKFCVGNQKFHINFCHKFPYILDRKRPRGFKFEGTSREMIINGKSYNINMNKPTNVLLSGKPHSICFGGPYHEVIINQQWYHIPFGSKPVQVAIDNLTLEISLPGSAPPVRILGYINPMILGITGQPGNKQ